MTDTSADGDETVEQSDSAFERECFKCGSPIRTHYSAYISWDEVFTLQWTPASNDRENVEVFDSGGTHPEISTREFCSMGCLEAFIQMDYPFPPESTGGEGDDDE